MEQLAMFIATTAEEKRIAEWVVDFITTDFSEKIRPVPWYHGWHSGDMTLQKLQQFADETDGSLFFWTPDDVTTSRHETRAVTRDNLHFEAGLFVGRHDSQRTQILIPAIGHTFQTYQPSDFRGVQFERYTAVTDDHSMGLHLPKTIRQACLRLLSLGPRTRPTRAFSQVTHQDELNSIPTLVGSEPRLELQWIVPELGTATRIDLVNGYRLNNEIIRELGAFALRADARLRVCFIDAWDEPLLALYMRKTGRTATHIRDAINSAIADLFNLSHTDPSSDHDAVIVPSGPVSGLAAHYQVFLTKQRPTYTYCRVDDRALMVPLDVKRQKNPRPPAWALSRTACPTVFDYYLGDIEKMLGDDEVDQAGIPVSRRLVYDSRAT